MIKVNCENVDCPTVSGRELHKALEVGTPYHKWMPRMCEYGFTENVDYEVTDIFVPNSNGGKQTQIDHQITLIISFIAFSSENNKYFLLLYH